MDGACRFKGNTLIDISPADTDSGYPSYWRAYYNKDKAPVKTVERYLSPVIFEG